VVCQEQGSENGRGLSAVGRQIRTSDALTRVVHGKIDVPHEPYSTIAAGCFEWAAR
jgi:hypothetical protein